MLIGYARVSTRQHQDITHQVTALEAMGIDPARIYTDPGFTGANTRRPGLERAMTAVRAEDTFVVTKLDRLARSVVDANALAAEIAAKGAKLRIGDSVHDPNDPMGQLLFNTLAMIAQFERDLISMRTKDGLVAARAAGRMKGRQPKLSPLLEGRMVQDFDKGDMTVGEIAKTYDVGKATVYRAVNRAKAKAGSAA